MLQKVQLIGLDVAGSHQSNMFAREQSESRNRSSQPFPALTCQYADAHSIQKTRCGCLRRGRFSVGIEPDHASGVATAAADTSDRRIAVSGEHKRKPAVLPGSTNRFRDYPRELERTADL